MNILTRIWDNAGHCICFLSGCVSTIIVLIIISTVSDTQNIHLRFSVALENTIQPSTATMHVVDSPSMPAQAAPNVETSLLPPPTFNQ